MKVLVEQVPHIPITDIELRNIQTYLQSDSPPSLKSYKKKFLKVWYRKIRSRRKQKSKNKTSNIYAIAHRQNQKNNNYLFHNTFLTFGDLKHNERFDNNCNINISKNPVPKIVKLFNHNELIRIADNIYHTFRSNNKIKESIILANFLYECPICFGHKNITGSFIHDCGHLTL